MKIGFDAKRLFNNFTRLGSYSRSIIDVLTQEYPEHEYYLYTPKVRLNDITRPYLHKEGCHTVQPQGLIKGSYWRTFRLAKDMKRDGIQLFHGLSNEMPAYMFHSGIPSVVTIHDVAFRTFPDRYHWQDRKIYDAKWKYACEHADRVIAISEMAKRDLMEFYNLPEHKVDVLYQSVDRRFYEPAAKKKCNPYMLYMGSVFSNNDLVSAIKAIKMLSRELQIPLVVIGKRSYKKHALRHISEQGMEHLVIWKDNVKDDELHRLYANAELFFYPSLHEQHSLPVIEAALSGCPVITNSTDCLPGVGASYALYADHNDIACFSEQIAKVLSDSEFRQQLSLCGREYTSKTFNPVVLAHQLMDIYSRLV